MDIHIIIVAVENCLHFPVYVAANRYQFYFCYIYSWSFTFRHSIIPFILRWTLPIDGRPTCVQTVSLDSVMMFCKSVPTLIIFRNLTCMSPANNTVLSSENASTRSHKIAL